MSYYTALKGDFLREEIVTCAMMKNRLFFLAEGQRVFIESTS